MVAACACAAAASASGTGWTSNLPPSRRPPESAGSIFGSATISRRGGTFLLSVNLPQRPSDEKFAFAAANGRAGAYPLRHAGADAPLERSPLAGRRPSPADLPIPPARRAENGGDVGRVGAGARPEPRAARGGVRQVRAAHLLGGVSDALPGRDRLAAPAPRGARGEGACG